MKALILLVLNILLCTSCTALPAEEKAFAVALCVEKTEGEWRVCGRIPTYQSGGGYMTVEGAGVSFAEAMAAMDAAAPIRINLSQLRLLTADVRLARAGELATMLAALSERSDMRMQCTVALTEVSARAVSEALKPAAGARLSKALDLMIAARVEQGSILPCELADVLRMGQRQSPIYAALTLEGEEVGLSGGYTADGVYLPPEETALLSLLLGHVRTARVAVAGGAAQVREASVKVSLSEDHAAASVELTAAVSAADLPLNLLEAQFADKIAALLSKLSAAGCDALGLGRQAMLGMHDAREWHALNWPEQYRRISWRISVGLRGMT